ncbi:L-gulonolactone oxidase 3 [Canna indica]|uniref:L-gulonolactone oxidase n=1 Tax=Canna indica TaxID=4628 RepID=A0AAQ3QPU1_9LILI|nr:L-gulonolactone oxidase 3 [Canna indica]
MASRYLLPLALLLVIASNPAFTYAKPPAPPVVCNDDKGCVVSNAYGAWNDRTECTVRRVVYPTSEDELLAAVADASRNRLKVKAVSGFSHTIPKLACPPPENDSVVISTAKYDFRIAVDAAAMTVTADSGVGLRDLIEKVEEAGLSLVAAPYWEGVSVGGLISTGSHGSSWWGKGAAVHDHVVGLSLVVPAPAAEGNAKIVRLQRGDPLFNAASVSLGLLGVISQVTLSLEPAFKRSITYSFQDDATFQDQFMDHAQKHEFADITWFPSQHQVAFRIDDRVPLNTSGDGTNDFVGFQSTLIAASIAVRAAEKVFDETRNVKGKCVTAAAELAYKKLIGNGLKNKIIFTGYPVVGRQGKMQTSGSCQHSSAVDILSTCAWDPRNKGLFFYESTAFFSAAKFKDFITDVKKLRDLNPDNFCGVDNYNGLMVRFVKKSESFLGQPEDSVVVDFNYYRARDPAMPRLNQDVWEEVEQMAFFKHGARPHWAKNRKVAFFGVQEKYPGFGDFVAAMNELDPQGMFQSPWSDEVINGGEPVKVDGCALEGQCICSEDRHCSPSKGYLCKPGLVYEEARVCRFSG